MVAFYAGQVADWTKGGNVASVFVADGVYILSHNNDGVWQFYSVQIFYKLLSVISRNAYRFHATIYSDVAGAIAINGARWILPRAITLIV